MKSKLFYAIFYHEISMRLFHCITIKFSNVQEILNKEQFYYSIL